MSKTPNPMPEGKVDAQIAKEFASFFLEKIEKNHTTIPEHWWIYPRSQHFSPDASASSTND